MHEKRYTVSRKCPSPVPCNLKSEASSMLLLNLSRVTGRHNKPALPIVKHPRAYIGNVHYLLQWQIKISSNKVLLLSLSNLSAIPLTPAVKDLGVLLKIFQQATLACFRLGLISYQHKINVRVLYQTCFSACPELGSGNRPVYFNPEPGMQRSDAAGDQGGWCLGRVTQPHNPVSADSSTDATSVLSQMLSAW